jgi:hypothetical protein
MNPQYLTPSLILSPLGREDEGEGVLQEIKSGSSPNYSERLK